MRASPKFGEFGVVTFVSHGLLNKQTLFKKSTENEFRNERIFSPLLCITLEREGQALQDNCTNRVIRNVA